MNKTDPHTTIQELKDLIVSFRDERGWKKHHSPRNLAISIAIEAAEIMEHFQWDDFSKTDKQEVATEIADVIAYCLSLADQLDIDVASTFRAKIEHNAKKYPLELFNPDRTGTEDYNRVKKSYRANKNQ